jgi:hypothetical protein
MGAERPKAAVLRAIAPYDTSRGSVRLEYWYRWIAVSL